LNNPAAPKRILILMSDTGGGHRAAANAISAALVDRHSAQVHVEIVDVFREHSRFPFTYAPELYPLWINRGKLSWRIGYRLSDGRLQARLIGRLLSATSGRGLRRLLLNPIPWDAIVCVHPLLSIPAMRILNGQPRRPAFITVVTDLVSTHALWYEPSVDRVLVPTTPAAEYALQLGLRPDQVRVTGLPVTPQFAASLIDKATARARLGWHPDRPALLLIGGGAGMGPLYRISRAIDALQLPCQLAIVAGHNAPLKAQLDRQSWNQPTHVYPFVTNMPELMAAADVLISKAGPATISEACMAGLPMILSDAIPGQEDGNVRYVVDNGAGVYAPSVAKLQKAVTDWLTRGETFLQARADAARSLAQPDAVWQVADEIWQCAQSEHTLNKTAEQPDNRS